MHELDLNEIKKEWHGTLKAYLIGFFFSLILTGISFYIALFSGIEKPLAIYLLVGLALIQAVAQLLFFLHLGQEASPQWETFIFCFMFLTLIIVVLGSLWIMHDLNVRTMPEMMEMHHHG